MLSLIVVNHALKIIATHEWEKTEDASFGYESIEYLISRFSTPLQETSIDIALIQEERDDIILYAKQYINVVQNFKAHRGSTTSKSNQSS